MNREIKFRAKRRSFNQWIYFNLLDEINSDKKPSEFLQYHLDKKTIGQFTGLNDKKGKEIYEGDIVKCGYGIGKVVFLAGCFIVEWIDDKESCNEFLFSRKGFYSRSDEDELFEVIGNIFDNPELLTKNYND